ncbi:uncharacterized protein LOC119745666, partial [Patiria miniata]|uniref:HTH CENPB-type domain-containing protein n=1 Tax=Patiria miniata TaxID=46514 RepID=A0A914BPQ0_PATMI
ITHFPSNGGALREKRRRCIWSGSLTNTYSIQALHNNNKQRLRQGINRRCVELRSYATRILGNTNAIQIGCLHVYVGVFNFKHHTVRLFIQSLTAVMSEETESTEPEVVFQVEGQEEVISEVLEFEFVEHHEQVQVEHVDMVEEHGNEQEDENMELEGVSSASEYVEEDGDRVDITSKHGQHDREPERYIINTVDIETTSDSSPHSSSAETDHEPEQPTKNLRSDRLKKDKESKTKKKHIKAGRITKRTRREKTRTASPKAKKHVGRRTRQSRQAQLKKEKIKMANQYLRKGLDNPTSAPEVADIPELERLKRGLEDLTSGKYKTVSAAAAYWRVHAGKLYRRYRGDIPCDSRHGPAPVLTGAEEEDLATWILTMSQRGFQVSAALVRDAVQSFFKRDNSPFINGRPSYRWYYSFLQRNDKLKHLKPSNLTLLCDSNPTKAVISEWFQELTSFLLKLGIAEKPGQIYNYAETGFEMNKNTDRIVVFSQAARGKSKPTCLKRGVIVGMCASADGRILPPFIIYRGQKMPQHWDPLDGAPKGSGTFFLEKDGEKQEAFSHWMEHHFLKNIGRKRPVVLLLSSHQSEISYKTYVTARQNHVYLFRIPLKAASLLQPIDVGGEAGEGPFRSAWIMKWVTENRSVPVNFHNVAQVINSAWHEAENSEAIRTCFIQSGIHPLDREMIDDDHLPEGDLDFLNKDAPQFEESLPLHASQNVHPTSDTNANDYPTADADPNVAEVVFHKLDRKLDKTTRETYRTCIKSGLDLEETPLFSVWKRLYLEAFHSNSQSSPRTRKAKRSTGSSKRQSPRGKRTSKHGKDDVFCPVCDERFGDDGGEDWIGCDGRCQSWYHVNCLPPEVVTPALLEDKEMVCPDCSSSR